MQYSPTIITGDTTMDHLPADIILQILRLLDGPSLASAAASSPNLRSLSDSLWPGLCKAAWPSTAGYDLSTLPGQSYRSFFADSFPLLPLQPSQLPSNAPPPDRLISFVDLRHGGGLLFSKVVETETKSDWFLSTPFRVDALDRTESAPSIKPAPPAKPFDGELSLSWVVTDPSTGRSANFSSSRPVCVQRHWLSGEMQVRFATLIGDGVQVGILVTCDGGGEGGDVQVKEVMLQVEDSDGMSLSGRESAGLLRGAMEGQRRRRGGVEEVAAEERRRYSEFVERKREKKENYTRKERRLDMACVVAGVSLVSSFWCLLLYWW